MRTEFKIGIRVWLLLSVLVGGVYPLFVTGVAQLFFPFEANGSLIENKGSILLGREITEETYFWGRPTRAPIDASNPLLVIALKQQIVRLRQDKSGPIPIDLISASGSQLDPDISPEAALYQVSRVAKARHIPEEKIEALVQHSIKSCTFGIFGKPRVNVALLNHELDKLSSF